MELERTGKLSRSQENWNLKSLEGIKWWLLKPSLLSTIGFCNFFILNKLNSLISHLFSKNIVKLVIILRIAPTKWPVLGPKLLSTGDSIKSNVIKKRNSGSNMATNSITLRKRIYLFYVCDFFCLCLCLQSSEEGIRHPGMGWAWLVGWGLNPGPSANKRS